MIQLRRLLFFISLIVSTISIQAQEEAVDVVTELDTIQKNQIYGIRVGIDISRPIFSFIDDNYIGFEIVADARFYHNFYVALEFGFDDKNTIEDYLNFSTNGSYAKLGVNYNAYDNWPGMNNEIVIGVRYGFSTFSQTLNSYIPNVYGTYFIGDTKTVDTEYTDLTAQWAEFVLGLKVETAKNLFLGFSFRFETMITSKEPENFRNMYVPGFNRVYQNNLGFGFDFTVSYLIPLKRKAK